MRIGQRTKLFLNDLPTWAQVGLVLAVVALISLLYPTGARLDYSYEQGRQWLYEDLYAPFSFPVRKRADVIEGERARVLEETNPYFLREETTGPQAEVEFRRSFARYVSRASDEFDGEPSRYAALGSELLDRYYRRGIAVDHPALENPPGGLIYVVRGATIEPVVPERIYRRDALRDRVADTLRESGLAGAEVLLPFLREAIRPNLVYSDSLTERFAVLAAGRLPTADGVVERGDLIVAADAVVTEETVRKLDSYRKAYEEQVVDVGRVGVVRLGYLLLTSVVLGTLLLYIRVFHPGEFSRFNRQVFILTLVLLACFAVVRIEELPRLSVLVFPFAAIPIIVRSFYPSGVALFTHLVVVLLATFLTGLGYQFAFLQLIGGIVAVLSPAGLRDWSKISRSLLMIGGAYLVSFIGLEFVDEGRFVSIDWSALQWLGFGFVLTLLAYPLVPLLGRVFGFTSEVDLVQLADVSRPALQRLSALAPGTMQHSLAVANLAEAAARELGADALLLRAAALYHDIGKGVHPEYFIENQVGRNPHERLDPATSAGHIIAHVEHGVRIGREVGLPAQLLEFIRTHHGTTRVEYFYRAAVDEAAKGEVDEALFRYPGPKPRSREEAILMLADSVEAASRSLKDPDQAELDKLVTKIVRGKVREGQLDQCALTLAEITRVRAVFRDTLRGSYHHRVVYPTAPEPEEREPEDAA